MTTQNVQRKNVRMRGVALSVALAVTASGGLLAPQRADAYIASEITQVLNNLSLLMNQMQDYGAYAADKLSWIQQARDMQNQIASIQNMQLTLGLKDGQELELIGNPKEFLVEERCGEANGGGLGGVIGNITGIDPRGKVFEQQYKICARKQWLQNEQYNVGVRYLKETNQEMQADYTKMRSQASSSKNLGDGTKVSADGSAMLNKYQMRQQNHEQLMDAYNAAIASLDNQTQAWGRMGMRGKSGLLRQVTTAGTVYTALCAGGRCD